MGSAKEAMIMAESFVFEETEVEFVCPKCGKLSDGSAEIPKIDPEFPDEIDTFIDVQCIWCHEDFNAEISLGGAEYSMELNGYPNTNVKFEPVYFSAAQDLDDWLEEQVYYDHSDDPNPVFLRSYDDVVSLLNEHGREIGHDSMNRMVFAQCFSMYEAYLCDAFLNFVFYDEDNQIVFLNKHKGVRKMTVPVSELAAHRELTADKIVRAKITQTIKETLFHNLAKAAGLYQMYGIGIFANKNEKDDLFKALEYRHDCVHRNGYDKEGNRLDVYTITYVQRIADFMKSSVSHIENGISEKKSEKFGF